MSPAGLGGGGKQGTGTHTRTGHTSSGTKQALGVGSEKLCWLPGSSHRDKLDPMDPTEVRAGMRKGKKNCLKEEHPFFFKK